MAHAGGPACGGVGRGVVAAAARRAGAAAMPKPLTLRQAYGAICLNRVAMGL